MSITACYSLAEGQDNSDIPEIDEIRASTFTQGNSMVVMPDNENSSQESTDVEGNISFFGIAYLTTVYLFGKH